MKIPCKREKIAFNRSSDIDFKDFMNLYKKCIAKPYSVLVSFSILVSFTFQRESFRKNIKLIMTIDDKIRDEKL